MVDDRMLEMILIVREALWTQEEIPSPSGVC
jgi:hypothetical protein